MVETNMDKPLYMPDFSAYAGRPIDLSERRSIEICNPFSAEEKISPDAEEAEVNYFFHEGEFWKAIVPLTGVQDVLGQAFNFSKVRTKKGKNGTETLKRKDGSPKRTIPGLNHIQARFIMKPDSPVRLFPLDSDQDQPSHTLTDFIYTVEVSGPSGVTFNVKDGLGGNLLAAHRFISTTEMVFNRLVVQSQYVTETPALELSEEAKRKLLRISLMKSDSAGISEKYYLYKFCGTNNCTSNPFLLLDQVVTYKFPYSVGALFYRLPFNPRFYLRIRGLDPDPNVRKLVKDEFIDFIEDPQVQQRKRNYVREQNKVKKEIRQSQTQF